VSALDPPVQLDSLLIRQVRLIDPASATDAVVDVAVRQGRVQRVTADGPAPESFERQWDGRGKVLVPGLVELRAHLGEPGFEYREDLESGLRAAAAGGFVHVGSQPDTSPVNDRRSVTEALCARARQLGGTELHPLAAATVGLKGEQLSEIGDLLDGGSRAVSSARSYVRSSTLMRRLLEYCRSFDALVMQQPQDPSLVGEAVVHEGAVSARLGLLGWARAAEEIALSRDLALCAATGARYHACSLTTIESVELLERARARNLRVSADVTPAHLLLSDDAVVGYDPRFRLEPPLRQAHDRQALLAALDSGLISCISSDHRPHSALETQCEFDQALPGATGLELCLPLIWSLVRSGELKALRAVAALCTGPASVLGLKAPRLAAQELASFALFDPEMTWTPNEHSLFSKGKNSPWWGQPLRGRVLATAHAGNLTFSHAALESAAAAA
jgi:dihydroorotase